MLSCCNLEWKYDPVFQNHETSRASFKLLKMVTTVRSSIIVGKIYVYCLYNASFNLRRAIRFRRKRTTSINSLSDLLSYSFFFQIEELLVSLSIKNMKISLDVKEDLHSSDSVHSPYAATSRFILSSFFLRRGDLH